MAPETKSFVAHAWTEGDKTVFVKPAMSEPELLVMATPMRVGAPPPTLLQNLAAALRPLESPWVCLGLMAVSGFAIGFAVQTML